MAPSSCPAGPSVCRSRLSPSMAARFPAMAPSSLSAASAKSCTPSSTRSSVTAASEMPAPASSSSTRCASSISGFERVGYLAVVAKRVERGRRNGVDGIGPDQLLDIEHVAQGLALGAGACPQQPLRLCPLCRQRFPALAGEQAPIALVGQLGIGDRDLALERREARLLVGIVRLRDFLVDELVDRAVDAADEEAGDARHPGDVAALAGQQLEAGDVSLGDLFIDRLREQQRDIDVDALGDQRPDGRQPGRRRRHLDHQVRAIDIAPQPLRLGDRGIISRAR